MSLFVRIEFKLWYSYSKIMFNFVHRISLQAVDISHHIFWSLLHFISEKMEAQRQDIALSNLGSQKQSKVKRTDHLSRDAESKKYNKYIRKESGEHLEDVDVVLYIVCNGFKFEITFVSEKHVGEYDILFTNHLVGKWEVVECCHSTWGGCGSSWLWLAQTSSYQLLRMTSEQCSAACHVTSDLEL